MVYGGVQRHDKRMSRNPLEIQNKPPHQKILTNINSKELKLKMPLENLLLKTHSNTNPKIMCNFMKKISSKNSNSDKSPLSRKHKGYVGKTYSQPNC